MHARLAVVGWAWPEIVGKFASDDVISTHALDALQQVFNVLCLFSTLIFA